MICPEIKAFPPLARFPLQMNQALNTCVVLSQENAQLRRDMTSINALLAGGVRLVTSHNPILGRLLRNRVRSCRAMETVRRWVRVKEQRRVEDMERLRRLNAQRVRETKDLAKRLKAVAEEVKQLKADTEALESLQGVVAEGRRRARMTDEAIENARLTAENHSLREEVERLKGSSLAGSQPSGSQ